MQLSHDRQTPLFFLSDHLAPLFFVRPFISFVPIDVLFHLPLDVYDCPSLSWLFLVLLNEYNRHFPPKCVSCRLKLLNQAVRAVLLE